MKMPYCNFFASIAQHRRHIARRGRLLRVQSLWGHQARYESRTCSKCKACCLWMCVSTCSKMVELVRQPFILRRLHNRGHSWYERARGHPFYRPSSRHVRVLAVHCVLDDCLWCVALYSRKLVSKMLIESHDANSFAIAMATRCVSRGKT